MTAQGPAKTADAATTEAGPPPTPPARADPETSMTAGRQVATQSTAPMMVIRPRATRTVLQPAAPEMAIQPRSATVPDMAIQPRTLPEMAIQPRAVETDSGPEDTQACTDFCARATRTTHNLITCARAARVTEKAVRRATGFEALRRLSLNKALGLQLPTSSHPASRQSSSGTEFLLNTPLQRTLSEFARRTHMPLPALVELVRGQTETDYRPNKHMVPAVIAQVCKDYQQLEKLQVIAAEGVRVELKKDVPLQAHPPDNHGSAIERVNILRKNVRKEQDAWRCLVLDLDLLAMWPEVFVSPFGIVDKAGGDPLTSGRTIHDLSFPEGASINDITDQDAIPKADYRHCDAVASEILRIKREHPDIEIKAMAGDVTSAFRNIPIHSRSVHHFAGRIEIENAFVVELACPFGWTGSPGEYEVIGGAIGFDHGSHEMERSLRYAMTAILDSGAVNEGKFTEWNTSRRSWDCNLTLLQKQSQYQPPRLLRPAILSHRRTTQVDSHGKCIAPPWEVCVTLPEPDVVVEMDACDYGLCALDTKANIALTYRFRHMSFSLLHASRSGKPMASTSIFGNCSPVHLLPTNGVPGAPEGHRPLHVHFRIDNTSAVAWQNRLASRNIIRLLGNWESSLNLRFSASHIAGVDNTRADAGSRIAAHPSYATKFKELTRGWTQVSPTIDVRGLSSLWRNISAIIPLPTPPSPTILSSAIKKAAAQNGEDPKKFNPHSFRAGGATHMYRAGVDAMTIQFHGWWVSNTFKTYTNLCAESVTYLAANMVTGSKGDSTLH
ncbi:unnamed protein product [Phytophthora fragariaefolia]|uniref:Unnamed protein product n=1 Tax=Phytophthora fragariaefolia TaxID=1490495 RepID=A0A9W6Y2Q1_9STRA|nr:unnamed protein product [Phytophthora fragariaefolia]